MKIITTTITKYELIGIDHLDPITIILEDLGPRTGRLTISCYGEAWTAYWGGMGERPLIDFLLSCNVDYVSDKLFTGEKYAPDFDGFYDKEVRELLRIRRNYLITKQDAARLWDLLQEQGRVDDYSQIDSEVALRLIGDEWWICVEQKTTEKYKYLKRIVTAVLDALKRIKEEA